MDANNLRGGAGGAARRRQVWEDGKVGDGDWEDGEVGEAAGWKCLSSCAYGRKMGEEERKKRKRKETDGWPPSQVSDLSFGVSKPNKKRDNLVVPQETPNGIVPSLETETGPSHLWVSPNQIKPKMHANMAFKIMRHTG